MIGERSEATCERKKGGNAQHSAVGTNRTGIEFIGACGADTVSCELSPRYTTRNSLDKRTTSREDKGERNERGPVPGKGRPIRSDLFVVRGVPRRRIGILTLENAPGFLDEFFAQGLHSYMRRNQPPQVVIHILRSHWRRDYKGAALT